MFMQGFPVAQMAKNLLQCRRPELDPWVKKIPWRREWQHTLVFLLGEFHGQRSLVGYSPWGDKELDMTERVTHTHCKTMTTISLESTRVCSVAQLCPTLSTQWTVSLCGDNIKIYCLKNFQYSHHAIHQIPRPYLSFSQDFCTL